MTSITTLAKQQIQQKHIAIIFPLNVLVASINNYCNNFRAFLAIYCTLYTPAIVNSWVIPLSTSLFIFIKASEVWLSKVSLTDFGGSKVRRCELTVCKILQKHLGCNIDTISISRIIMHCKNTYTGRQPIQHKKSDICKCPVQLATLVHLLTTPHAPLCKWEHTDRGWLPDAGFFQRFKSLASTVLAWRP